MRPIPAFVLLPLLMTAPVASAAVVVFSTDFDTSLPAAVSAGVAAREGVQGYAGLGSPGNAFGGSFLRSPTGNVVTVTLDNLPPHTSLSIDVLFAAIDSLDGTGTFPEGDFFRVTLDGVTIFRESFANALPSQIQSYIPPPGVTLARRVDLGFGGPGSYYTDSAYDLSLDPAFHNLRHSAPNATLTFTIEGPGIQSLDDESWAIDNLRVSVQGGCGCPSDLDDGSGSGVCDGGVTVDDLLYYIALYDSGSVAADVDDGTGTGSLDGGVTIDDLLYYLVRFEAGC